MKNYKNKNILVIGSAHLDILAEYEIEAENDIDKIGSLTIALGGSAYNIAVNLAMNNVPVELLTVLKKDSFSFKLINDSLIQKKISNKYVILGNNNLPESGFVAHRQNGKLKSAVSSTIVEKVSINDNTLRDAIKSSSCIVIDCNISIGQISRIIQISEEFNKDIFVCAVSESKVHRAIVADGQKKYKLFSMNSLEAKKCDIYKNVADWDESNIIRLCEFFKSETVIITNGQKGYSVFHISGWKKDYKPRNIVNPISELGAGDALLSGIVAYYYENGDINWNRQNLTIETTIERYMLPVLSSIGATPDADHTISNYDYFILLKTSIFGEPREIGKKNDVFILMPFIQPFYDISDNIKGWLNELHLKCRTAKDIFSHEAIIKDIWSYIYFSKIIIADCTGRNPNVFYEIGIAHTLGKPTILLTQNPDDIPFDLKHIRHIIYELSIKGIEKMKNDLLQTIKTLI